MAPRKRPLPPIYLYAALAAMVLLHFVLPIVRIIRWPWRVLGAFPLAFGVVINIWADRLFKKYDTEVKPFMDSSTLVTEGPFRISRNPMYLGAICILAGLGVLLGSLSPLAVVPVMFWLATAHFIIPEEADMERQFGRRYREYKERVRRWI